MLSAVSIPFAHLNLRRNPFGEFSLEEVAALAKVEIGDVAAQLDDPTFAVQFVGEKGFGKTTHLLAIRARFPGAGYVHIAEGERGVLPAGRPLLIDEAQRLTWRQQRKVFHDPVPLVLGTHVDFHRALTRAGRQVKTIRVAERMNTDRLHDLLNARIAWVRREDGPVPAIRRETARRLLAQFGPDVRRIQQELYLTFQRLSGIHDV